MSIRVVFLQDAPPKYLAGDIREVSGGYARNYLIPQGIAAPAAGDHLNRIEKVKRVAEEHRLRETQDMEELAQHLEGTIVAVQVRAGDGGRLYGSVTAANIAEELTRLLNRPIDRRLIQLPEPIKEVGSFQVPLRLYSTITATVTVSVEAEGGSVAQVNSEVVAEEPAPAQPAADEESQEEIVDQEGSEPHVRGEDSTT